MFRLMALVFLLLARPALAQPLPFCNGAVLGESFWNIVTANATVSQVAHMVQLRNPGPRPVALVISFIHPGSELNLRRAGHRLGAYGSVTLRLGVESRANPSGSGALQVPDVAGFVVINCG